MRLTQGGFAALTLPEGWTTALVVLKGSVQVNGAAVREAQMAVLDRNGRSVSVEASSDAVVLLLAGEPIDEPIIGYGPFVMNSQQEIAQAINDFQNGRFGLIPN
jgi:redox-sensitive bicupin YhaK (pirin superfamily)